jgi:uracil-DNA glycosylase
MTLRKILDDLSAYIEHTVDEGTTSIALAPDVAKSIRDGFKPFSKTERATLSQAPAASRAEALQGKAIRGFGSASLPREKTTKQGSAGRKSQTPAGVPSSAAQELAAIAKSVASCTKCPLHKTRTRTVPGQGSAAPEIMFIGEAPGADEDIQGLAFVGRAGQLLTKMIEAMGYKREEVFIANILKCRPPGNATPLPEQMEACFPYLKSQIAAIKPKVIVTLGAVAARGLLNTIAGITRLRGTWQSYDEIPVMPTYHPSYLLRNPAAKREVWEDLKEVLKHLGKEPPKRKA